MYCTLVCLLPGYFYQYLSITAPQSTSERGSQNLYFPLTCSILGNSLAGTSWKLEKTVIKQIKSS